MNFRKRFWALLIEGMVVVLAMGLALAAFYNNYFWFDPWIARGVQRITLPGFRELMIAVSGPGYRYHWLIVSFCAAVSMFRQKGREAFFLVLSAVGAWILNNLLKILIARPRPASELVMVYLQHQSLSFPSGHVMSYVALYGLLFYMIFRSERRSPFRTASLVFFAALIGLVGLSRVYLGAHWPSDVVGGYLFGAVWLSVMIRLYSKPAS